MFRDGVLIGAGTDRDGNAMLGGGGHVHRVVTDAGSGNDAELRIGCDDAAGVRLRPGNAGGDALELFECFLFGHLERPVGVDQLEASFAKQFQIGAADVGKGLRCDQAFRHGEIYLKLPISLAMLLGSVQAAEDFRRGESCQPLF